MIIDFHTHCFPDVIAEKAIAKLSYSAGGLHPYTNGTLAGLKANMENDGVNLSVVLSIATNAAQQHKVNDFAALINADEHIEAFGSVFPESVDALEELERIKSLGLKGVKLHPDYQGFFVDDEKMKPLYRKISQLGLITVFHAGVDYGFKAPYGATPERLATALKWFDSPVVAAHFGGMGCWEGVQKYLCGTDIYMDTAFGYSQLPKCEAQAILDKHSPDRVLFGTDTPWHTAEMEMRLLNTLNLSDEYRQKILSGNALKLLGCR